MGDTGETQKWKILKFDLVAVCVNLDPTLLEFSEKDYFL